MLSAGEPRRKTIHLAAGCLALSLRWIGPPVLALVAALGVLFNAWVLPRFGGLGLWREDERRTGRAPGIVFYPLTVLLLLTLFGRRPEVAAAGWGLLAFADGGATVAGKRWGRRSLPWNGAKSWVGLSTYFLTGWAAVAILLWWIPPAGPGLAFSLAVSSAVALVAALLESLPQRLDDNLGAPLLGALLLACLLETEAGWSLVAEPAFQSRVVAAVVVNALFAALAYRLALLDFSGALSGWVIGSVIFGFLDWSGWAVLLAFLGFGTLATRAGFDRKRRLGLQEAREGRRSVGNALANGAVAAGCALFAVTTPWGQPFTAAFVAALAAAAADTVESEIGQPWGRPTLLITTLKPVVAGTDGGISPHGTAGGLLAAGLTTVVAWATGLVPAAWIAPLTLAAVASTLVESLIGATLERRGLLGNEGVNFLNTLIAALLGAAFGRC